MHLAWRVTARAASPWVEDKHKLHERSLALVMLNSFYMPYDKYGRLGGSKELFCYEDQSNKV